MTHRLQRSADFELSLVLGHDDLVRPPRDSQRNWLLYGAMHEMANIERPAPGEVDAWLQRA